MAGVAVDPGNDGDLDRWRDRAGVAELSGQGVLDPGRDVGRSRVAQRDRDVQAVGVVDDLVLADLQQLGERCLEPERVDRDPAAAGRRQGDDVVAAPVHGGDAGVRQAERIGPASQGDRVGQLVADQRLDPADQAGQQHLLPRDAGWHRTVPVVHDLEHHQVLQNVHASLAWAAGRGDQRLGGPVEVDRLQPPGVGHALAHVGRLHLRAGADHRRRDPQPALELLLGQRGRHRWVGGQGLGLEGVQGSHHLGQRSGHGQPRGGAGLPGQQHGVHLVGDVARAGGADPGQPGRRPQTPAGQAPQAGPDPDGELVDVLHEQPAYPGGPGGGEHLVPPQVRPVGGGRGQVRLQVRPAKPAVGDDPVEVVHHRRLGQRRQLP